MNGTRALTCKYNAQLSCGRVQTPTLAMIQKREEGIRKFVPKEYYGISLETQDVKWTWCEEKTRSFRTFSREKAEQIKGKLENASLEVTNVEKKAKKTMAPGLYDLTTCNGKPTRNSDFPQNRPSISCKDFTRITKYSPTSYRFPLPHYRYRADLKERLKACAVGPYSKIAGRLSMQKLQANKSFVNDSKVSDHHAIIRPNSLCSLTT